MLQATINRLVSQDDDQAALALASEALSALQDQQQITALDRYTGLMMLRRARCHSLMVCALATFLSHFRGRGHTCVELDGLVDRRLWRQLVGALDLKANWGVLDETGVIGLPGEDCPIIQSGSRLYFQKVLRAETALVDKIHELASKIVEVVDISNDKALPGFDLDEAQLRAIQSARRNRLCLISGGPGTGKTTVAAAILSAFIAEHDDGTARVGLAAPTGKAAARLQQAVNRILAQDATLNGEGHEAATVHRLLAWSPARRSFRFNAENQLPLELLIVDEVSMIDLELMRALMDAVPSNCSVVLLGDREQLASVAPGNVMADLCAGFDQASRDEQDTEATGLRPEQVVLLTHNHRFDQNSGIHRLAQAVSEGDNRVMMDVLCGDHEDVVWLQQQDNEGFSFELAQHIPETFISQLSAENLSDALGSLDSFRVLTAVRHGPFGSLNLNRLIEQDLRKSGVLETAAGFASNQIVMATGNDYSLRLFNGDIGLIRRRASGELAAAFVDAESRPRWVSCDRLQTVESAFASTIHKSQGSEFEQVLIVLPEPGSPVLSRELLYTAITRARYRVTLVASVAALEAAVSKRTQRFSGLAERLWGR